MDFKTNVQLSGTDVSGDAKVALAAIEGHAIIRMKPISVPSDLRTYYDQLVEAIGTPIETAEDYLAGGRTTGERWLEIRYDAAVPDDIAFRYSKNAQPLHTDESYISNPAGVMLFYCVHAAPSGGETIFVSGDDLVRDLRERRPQLLDRLLSIDVTYEKAGDSRHRPIIQFGGDKSADLNYNYFCSLPKQNPAALALNQEFHDYLEHELPSTLIHAVGLKPGESLVWRDEKVLHGRNAFVAQYTDDRLIWKTKIVLPTR